MPSVKLNMSFLNLFSFSTLYVIMVPNIPPSVNFIYRESKYNQKTHFISTRTIMLSY